MEPPVDGSGSAGRGAPAATGRFGVSAASRFFVSRESARMARPEKVAVVEEIRTKFGGGRRDRPHRVPRPHRARAREPARRRCARPAPSTRSSRTRWRGGPSRRPASTSWRRCFEGPVAIAFVRGDAAAAAKALRDFGSDNPALDAEGRPARARECITPARYRGARPTCRHARRCWRRSPACSRPRSPRPPACSRPSPATSPTA